jgi:hypothetical protein
VGDPVVAGSGLSTGGAVVCEALGAEEAAGAPEPLGVTDGLADRDGERDGEGDRDGLGTDRVGLGVTAGVELGTAGETTLAGTGIGRTRMYSARIARNRPEMTRVEVRGCPLTRHPRWTGRYRGQRRR